MDRERLPIRFLPVAGGGGGDGYQSVSAMDKGSQTKSVSSLATLELRLMHTSVHNTTTRHLQMRHFQLSNTEVLLDDVSSKKPWCQDITFGYATFFLVRLAPDHLRGTTARNATTISPLPPPPNHHHHHRPPQLLLCLITTLERVSFKVHGKCRKLKSTIRPSLSPPRARLRC